MTFDVASVSSSLVVIEVYDDSGFATKVLSSSALTDTIETVTYVSTSANIQSIVWRVALQSPSSSSRFLNYSMAITCSSCYDGTEIIIVIIILLLLSFLKMHQFYRSMERFCCRLAKQVTISCRHVSGRFGGVSSRLGRCTKRQKKA